MAFTTISYTPGVVRMIDQRLLPTREVYREYRSSAEVADAITTMVVRGAPAIGIAAAFGMALAAREAKELQGDAFYDHLDRASRLLASTRPTAVNLFWALKRQGQVISDARSKSSDVDGIIASLEREAQLILEDDIERCKAIGRFGGELLATGQKVLTHCNAGALATGGYGTALGVIRGAIDSGKLVAVYADETRPFLQGSRLTAWELQKDEIPVTLITDNMAASIMARGDIDRIVVGADRIAANGDTANKIGTLNVAILAKHFGIPFTVAAPRSTIDMSLSTGKDIPIEQRSRDEVTAFGGNTVAPDGIAVENPAFDVTPAELIDTIVTEKGVLRAPFTASIREVMADA